MDLMRFAAVALVAAVLTATTACSAPAPEPSPTPFSAVIEQQLDWARTNGAAPEQIEVLEGALVTGEVTMEQVVDLNTRLKDCLITAGFTVRDTGMEEILQGSGIRMPGFLANQPDGMDDIAANAVMDECNEKYFKYAQSAYMSQPTVLDQYFAVWDTPEVRQCLIDHGYDVGKDATGHDLNLLSGQDAQDHMSDPNYRACG